MKQRACIQNSVPDDIALKIASSLQLSDLCALGSCSWFWRELCESDFLWISLFKDRWPFLDVSELQSSSASDTIEGWRSFYIRQHNEMSERASAVIKFVEHCSSSESLEVGTYLKAIEDMRSMRLGFKDVQMFLFKPNLNVLLNLAGLHYCIHWLGVPAEHITEALDSCNISERKVCVKWWKLGRWLYGFRLRDESYSRWVSLRDLAIANEEEVLEVLQRGAIHEVLRVQISVANPTSIPWSCQSTQTLG